MTPAETISARLQRLESYLQLLEGFRTEPRSALLGDPVRRGALERYLQLAIEALLDIGNHLLARRGLERPETYADVFRLLCEADLLSEALLEESIGMAGFRNLLVHDYMRLEPEKLGEILDAKLEVMRQLASTFARQI